MVPRKRITDPELRLLQYPAIDEFTRLRFPAAYPEQSTCSSADFLQKLVNCMPAAVFTSSVSGPTMALSSPTVSPTAGRSFPPYLKPLLPSRVSGTGSYTSPQQQGGTQPP